jgi:hypothetical protein
MVIDDAQSQAPRAWTNQKKCQLSDDRRQHKRTGRSSQSLRSESISSSGNDREGRNTVDGSGDVTAGGTIQQLIADTLAEIGEIDDRREKLSKRVADLQDLLKGLQDKSQKHQK